MKKTLLMATGALVAAGFAVDANAVDVELYGQVNKTVISADNGKDTETTFRDNDISSSRVGLKGEQALDNGLTASVLVEYEINDNGTNDDLTATNTGAPSDLTERHARVGLAGDFGAIFIGHTSIATDGITEIDLAGVSDILTSAVHKIGGGTAFNLSTKVASTITVGDVFGNFDGGREDAIVYHSPVIAGFQGQLSTSEGGDVQGAVRYSGKFDAFAVKGGIGYTYNGTGVADADAFLDSTLAGSLSVKHDSGLAGTVSFGKEDRSSGFEADNLYFKLGYAWDAFQVAVDYTKFDTDNLTSREGKAVGVGGQYNLGHGVSLAAAYRTLEIEETGVNYEDIDLIMANLRVKF